MVDSRGRGLLKILAFLYTSLGAFVTEIFVTGFHTWTGPLSLKAGLALLLYISLGVLLYLLASVQSELGTSAAKQANAGAHQKEGDSVQLPNTASTLQLIKERRSIMPKDLTGERLSDEDICLVMEAANWAPTHHRSEPWRYVIISGPANIVKYLEFLDTWYSQHREELPEADYSAFLAKYENMRSVLPDKASHLIVICMKRQALPDKRLPEWEEICATAASVQNIYLSVTSMQNCGGFWSSHTWCKHARDSTQFKEYLGLVEEDRVFGAFILGKVKEGRKFRSSRGDWKEKVIWRTGDL